MYRIILLFAFALTLVAQSSTDNSGARDVRPWPIRTVFPGVCNFGEMMTRRDLPVGANTFQCGASNDWNQIVGFAANGSGVMVGTTLSVAGSNGQISLTGGSALPCTSNTYGLWADLGSSVIKFCNNGTVITPGAASVIASTSTAGLVIPRDGLQIDGSGNLDVAAPVDATLYQWDALITESGCPTGWTSRGTGTAGGTDPTSITDIGGRLKLNSASSASTYFGCEFGGSNLLVALNQNAGWDSQMRFQLGQTTNTRFYIGYGSYNAGIYTWTSSTNCSGCTWFGLRYDTNATTSDADLIFQTCFAGSCTNSDTGVAADTNMHRLRIQSTTAGQIIFTLYSASGTVQAGPTTININSSGVATVTAIVRSGNDTTASTSFVNLNKFAFRMRGLSR